MTSFLQERLNEAAPQMHRDVDAMLRKILCVAQLDGVSKLEVDALKEHLGEWLQRRFASHLRRPLVEYSFPPQSIEGYNYEGCESVVEDMGIDAADAQYAEFVRAVTTTLLHHVIVEIDATTIERAARDFERTSPTTLHDIVSTAAVLKAPIDGEDDEKTLPLPQEKEHHVFVVTDESNKVIVVWDNEGSAKQWCMDNAKGSVYEIKKWLVHHEEHHL